MMIGGVRRAEYEDSPSEAWERDIEADDGDVRYVEAGRDDHSGGWQVTVPVMEFVREESLEGELRRRIAAALLSVEGVGTADEMDREAWYVTGAPSGEALVRAVGKILDGFAERTLPYAR